MKKEVFYKEYANTPLGYRCKVLTLDERSPIAGMSLQSISIELHKIDDKLRKDEIRRADLLKGYEMYLALNTR